MKLFLVLAVAAVQGCCLFQRPHSPGRDHANAEIVLTDFSKVITAHYALQGQKIPADFDEAAFFKILEEGYPDKEKLRCIKTTYRTRVKALHEGLYDVILCDPDSSRKLMEDLSCTKLRVDASYWREAVQPECDFQPALESNCQ